MLPIAQNQTQWDKDMQEKLIEKLPKGKTTMGKTFPKSQWSKFGITREIITISIKTFVYTPWHVKNYNKYFIEPKHLDSSTIYIVSTNDAHVIMIGTFNRLQKYPRDFFTSAACTHCLQSPCWISWINL